MTLQNSWTYKQKGASSKDVIKVEWARIDDAVPPLIPRESGEFDYTKPGAEDWTTSKANIEAKVTAKDGQYM